MTPTQRSPGVEGPKRRACDECRSRKLACTKEVDGCSRCRHDGVRCHYSQQKQMGRPRKVKRPQDAPPPPVEDGHNDRHPVVVPPANQSPLDLDLDMAFFDVNDVSFLDLLGPNSPLGMSTPNQATADAPKQPAQPMRQTHPPGIWQIMNARHLAEDINFESHAVPQPVSVTEEINLEQAAKIVAPEIPEALSLPALSPQHSSTSSDDPAVSEPYQSSQCTCVASLYLALDSLQHLPSDVRSALHAARSASKAAHNSILCPVCSTPPLDTTTASVTPPIQSFQAMMMLGALLPSISNAYKTVLRMVDEEAQAADLASRKITFQLGPIGGLWGSLGTNGLCGASQNVDGRELDPAMWRLTVRALLKIDVYGLEGCTPGWVSDAAIAKAAPAPPWQPGLKDIIQMMEERSRKRHEQIDALVAAGVLNVDGQCNVDRVPSLNGQAEERPTCMRIIDIAKKSMQSLDIP